MCYVVYVDGIEPIEGKDRVECARVGGWTCMVPKDSMHVGDPAIYFEIDSKLPEVEPFKFLEKRHYKIKTQKFKAGEGYFFSQGLLMAAADFGWTIKMKSIDGNMDLVIIDKDGEIFIPNTESAFLTKKLNVTYADAEDNKRKGKTNPDAAINSALGRHPKIAKKYGKFIKNHKVARWLFLFFFGKKKDKIATHFPTHFPYISKTDQERCENMVWVLTDKTPFIVTQKCDGSSGTYILEKKKTITGNKYEFYVCSRNVRQLTPNQQSYYEDNYYWECAIKYDIENKLKDYLIKHPDLDYVCWQGEICAPKIQGNPQHLTETHLFCFHMIDSKIGKYDIREAAKIWKEYNMEIVPIVDENYILPDDFEEFKQSAENKYDPSVCEGNKNCAQEGYVYYKTTDPNFSFKNVSRNYLLKHSK